MSDEEAIAADAKSGDAAPAPVAGDTPPAEPAKGVLQDMQGPSFQEISASATTLIPVADYIGSRIEIRLWTGLVAACGELLESRRSTEPFGIVAAEEPILGLAAAQALSGGRLQVPVAQAQRGRRAGQLEAIVNQHMTLGYLRETLPKTTTETVAMLGWRADLQQIEEDLAATRADDCRVICLIQAPQSDVTIPRLLVDLSGRWTEQILASAIVRLGLAIDDPGDDGETADQLVQRLLERHPVGVVVSALNTKRSSGFRRLMSAGKGTPAFKGLVSNVLSKSEEHPRAVASLFAASHFEPLAPAEFLELADLLAAHTPTWQHPVHRRRPADWVTDDVLDGCLIEFQREDRTLLSIFAQDADDMPRLLQDWFDGKGALLRERYLNILAQQMTLGHPHEFIAGRFAELELEQMVATQDPAVGRERLRRVVFGHAASVQAPPDGAGTSPQRLAQAFTRAIQRAPDLIRKSARGGAFTVGEAIGALALTDPANQQRNWPHLLRWGAAAIFWSLYGTTEDSAAFGDFLPWFIPAVSDGSNALRRQVAIDLIDAILQVEQSEELAGFESHFGQYEDPSMLARLLIDIGEHFERMLLYDRGVPVSLLARIGAHHLMRNLHGRRWAAVRGWRDLARDARIASLADALLGETMQAWLRGPDLETGEESGTAEVPAAGDARDIWRALYTTLDALTGCASLGAVEDLAIQKWFQDVSDWTVPFHLQQFWNIERSAAGRAAHPGIAEALQPLADMFPVVVLMAATVSPAVDEAGKPRFVFGPELESWLRRPTDIAGNTPARHLVERIRGGLILQRRWNAAQARLNVRLENREAVRRAFEDRHNALTAFHDAVRAIAVPIQGPARQEGAL